MIYELSIYIPAAGDADISPKEEEDSKTLVDLMMRIYPDVFSASSKLSVFKEPKVPHTFPAIKCRLQCEHEGLGACIEYLTETFGKAEQVKRYLAQVLQRV